MTLRCALLDHNYVVYGFGNETAHYQCQRCGYETDDYSEAVGAKTAEQ